MAIKIRVNNFFNFSFFGFLLAFSLVACDQPERNSSVSQENKHAQLETSNETAALEKSEKELFSFKELEQQLLPLQTQIKRLEAELEEKQNSSVSNFEKNDNKQWNVAKLKETISTLQEDNQDLQVQLKEQFSENKVLQDALSNLEASCKQEDSKI